MAETERTLRETVLRIVIAVVVPVTVALIGIYGEAIVAEMGAAEQKLERIVRRAEAETSFRRQMFASLFTGFVDQISKTDDPVELDALTTRLELLSSNFSDFLNLQPLFFQLDRKIKEVIDDSDAVKTDDKAGLRAEFLGRLNYAANFVINDQVQKVYQEIGMGREVRIPLDYFEDNSEQYVWPENEVLDLLGLTRVPDTQDSELSEIYNEIFTEFSSFSFEGVEYQIEMLVSNPDIKRKEVKIRYEVYQNKEGRHLVSNSFRLDKFNFPLENYTVLPDNRRTAVTLQQFDNDQITLGVLFFSKY